MWIKFRIKILMWSSTTNYDKITFQYVFDYSFKLIKKDKKTSFSHEPIDKNTLKSSRTENCR